MKPTRIDPRPAGSQGAWIALLFICLITAAQVAPADCIDYNSNIRWVRGDNFGWYIPGYGSAAYAYDVAATLTTAFLAHETGIYSYDIINLSHPAEAGFIEVYAHRLDASGNHVYALTYNELLVIRQDLNSNLVLEGSVQIGDPRDLVASPPYVYVANGLGGLSVVSVSGPPVVVATLSGLGTASRIALGNRYVYLGSSNGVWVIDVTIPDHPAVVGHIFQSGEIRDVATGGDGLLYVTDSGVGLRVFTLADPRNPAEVAALPLVQVGAIAAASRHVLVDENGSIGHVDATVPNAPQLTGAMKGLTFLGGDTVGGLLYAAAGWTGFQVIDFTHPTNPGEAAFLADGLEGRDLIVRDTRLSLITDSEFLTFDVGDPLAPVRLGSYPVNRGQALAMDGDRAYVLDRTELKILDVSSPANPVLLGSFAVYGDDIAAVGNRAFVMEAFSFLVLDVSDPSNVTLLREVQTSLVLFGLGAVTPDTVYGGGIFEGTSYIDEWNVADPAHPYLVGEAPIEGPEEGMALVQDRLVVSGPFVAAFDPNDLGHYEPRVGVGPFGGTVAIGSSLAYSWNGIGFSVFSLDPLRYVGSGGTDHFTQTGGIAEVGSYLYVTDAAGIHVFEPPCGASGAGGDGIVAAAGLAPAFPDPFRERTELRFRLDAPSAVDLSIFDLNGRRVRTLAGGTQLPAGAHALTWDGRDESGRETPAGVYWVRLGAGGRALSGRIVRVP